ncbi:DMT family transporter [Paenibacillus puerhi]|uniref:DMT family transporter n=1 Tax=Paenibacillus puerhi TaxID=2692622 RepID=UPI00135AA7BE|nr:EamA family transporter [Paenibacillus puerhi]
MSHPPTRSRIKGIILVLAAAGLWGISGTVVQYLFERHSVNTAWLVDVRLLLAGALLLGFAFFKEKRRVWGVWSSKRDAVSLLLFSIFGMVAVQYTFFSAIEHSNAATATVLQCLSPVLISCYLAIRGKRWPTIKELVAVCLSFAGTYLLVTHGQTNSLSISWPAFLWGIGSAVALVIYTLQPQRLLARWGSTVVVGWGMLLGGIAISFVHPPWSFQGEWSLPLVGSVLFVVLFGTLISFCCYLESLTYISASETSVLATFEPLTAAFLSVAWLQLAFGWEEWLGTVCILSTIFMLAFVPKKKRPLGRETGSVQA